MTTPTSMFVKQLSSLCNELSEMYPEDVDIRTAKKLVDTLKSANPKLLVKSFTDYVLPYKDHILSKNDSFFISDLDYSKIDGVDEKNLVTAMNLKKYWSSMSDNSKETLWTYFKVLVVLAEKI
jgi:hypothetical protein